jgi:hypothetical protein
VRRHRHQSTCWCSFRCLLHLHTGALRGYADAYAYSHSYRNPHSDVYTDAHAHRRTFGYAYSNSDTHGHSHVNTYADAHVNAVSLPGLRN